MRTVLQRILRTTSLCVSMAAIPSAWAAGETVTIITPLATGTASDVALRIVAEKLSTALAQPIVIDNQAGASGAIGAEKVARATPDGTTLCGCNNAILGVLPHVRKVPFTTSSFKPVGMVAVLPTVLVVNPSLPVNSLQELLAYVKANPGKVSYATGGVGSAQHIAMSMLEAATGARMLHVPYKGASPAAVAVASGEVQVMFNAIGTVMPLIKSGKLRAIAVAGAQRTPVMADLPTVAEQGVPGYDYASWIGIVAPAATPDAVVNRISGELAKVLRDPDTVKRLADNGIDPSVMTPAQMRDYVANDYARMAKVVADAGMKE
ncbi:tripartite tricarboxylate transporter substrate binding protein [Ramlibacter sp.]|uniref:Bug family tripartite tricarboxylate transporter substrate binding protein n=1 Tax=Ramlibacter sp. TaxID=1917967 RepID=UPI00262B14D1|nr:tripartite tricarboxylate transporter substrate binding protein [Ramlibacter sp.]MDB5955440.1 tripartite tricarboxylate transporter substrate binding protein [Ramlibacter sp.]